MSLRYWFVAVLCVATSALAGCTSSAHHGPSSAPSTSGPSGVPSTPVGSTGQVLATSTGVPKPVSAYCTKLQAANVRIQSAQVQLYTAGGKSSAVTALVTELHGLAAGAPAQTKKALDDMADGFGKAEQLLADPTAKNKAALAAVGSKLATDGQQITAYVAAAC